MLSFLRRLMPLRQSGLEISNAVGPFCQRHMSENKLNSIEKCVNRVTLLGRVGINPQLRGTENSPVVIFTVATNMNYKQSDGDFKEKTDWHRISIFKPFLRNTVFQFLKKGNRVYIEGRIMYGEITDIKGVNHVTTTIVAEDVIFLGSNEKQSSSLEEKID